MTSVATALTNQNPWIYSPSDTGTSLPLPERRVIESQAKTDDRPAIRLAPEGREGLDNTTDLRPVSDSVFKEAERILAFYYSDCDSDESGQRLALHVRTFVQEFRSQAVRALSNTIIQQEEEFQDAICDTLQILGCLEYPSNHLQRLWLLEKMLQSRFARIRYGAALGLAYLRDEHSTSYLQAAIEKEIIPELKATFNNVLSYLERDR